MVGLITGHPHPSMRKADFDPDEPCKHFVQSPPFASMFYANQRERCVRSDGRILWP